MRRAIVTLQVGEYAPGKITALEAEHASLHVTVQLQAIAVRQFLVVCGKLQMDGARNNNLTRAIIQLVPIIKPTARLQQVAGGIILAGAVQKTDSHLLLLLAEEGLLGLWARTGINMMEINHCVQINPL